jgi:fatty acid desaturase
VSAPADAAPLAQPPGEPPDRAGSDYAELSRIVRAAGLLRRRPGYYTIKITANLLALAGLWTAFGLLGRTWWQLAVAAGVAVVATQLAFIGHDAGHRQVCRSRQGDDLIGRIHGNLLTGLSYGWWTSRHNRHHAHPNTEGRDPDIDSAVLAFSPDQARVRRGAAAWLARRQAWLFFPMLLLEGINLHAAGIRALGDRRPRVRITEVALLVVHFGVYLTAVYLVLGPWHGLAFIAVQQAVFGVYMGCSFAPNHKGMTMLGRDEKLDYLRTQVLTSRNIHGNWLTDWALGGLNYQIEHHLFPSMPRPSLRHAQATVRAFCARHDVPYCETSFLESWNQVLSHLAAVAPARD